MIRQHALQSILATDIRRYIETKQALGRSFESISIILFKLDRFLFELGKPPSDLTPETFRKWSHTLEPLSPNTRAGRMRAVRNFCVYRHQTVPTCFVPDPTLFPKACPPVQPHIFSEDEVSRLLHQCDGLPEDPARAPLRWAGTRLAIVLLYTTGLRRGELLRLTPQDYDPRGHTLLIQASKFHKSRLLPLPNDVAQQVDKFLQIRRSAYPCASAATPLIYSPSGRDRAYSGTRLAMNLRILFDRAGVKKVGGGRPRVHDFRHSHAVNALLRWYRAGADVQAKLPLLATWLGHVSILSTYHYLHFAEQLRAVASSRFADAYSRLVVPAGKNGVD